MKQNNHPDPGKSLNQDRYLILLKARQKDRNQFYSNSENKKEYLELLSYSLIMEEQIFFERRHKYLN